MKSIYVVRPGQEIMSRNTGKSLNERIGEGEKELADTLRRQQILIGRFLDAKLCSEEELINDTIDYSFFRVALLVKQLFVLRGMRAGNIVHTTKYSRKTKKGHGRAWSADPVFDYLLDSNHQEFKAGGRWEAYDETSFHDDEPGAYRLKLLVLLDF